jgi:signal transduction histidine kinase
VRDDVPLEAAGGPVSPGQPEPAAGCSDAAAAAQGRADAWDGQVGRWDMYFAIVLIAALILVQVANPQPERYKLIASSGLVAMVPWYLLVGRRAMFGAGQPAWRGYLYVAGLVPLFVISQVPSGIEAFVLFALCPQCFMAIPFRRAIVAVIALNLVPVVVVLARNGPRGELESVLTVAVLAITFSVVFGTWIMRIISQSEERAELIAQLERTRAELAEVSRQAGQLAERERLASEIHDTLAQGFTSIVMLAQAAEAAIGTDQDLARAQLGLVAATARENLAEARALVAGLAPAPLERTSLADALARLTDRAATELGVRARFEVDGAPRPLPVSAEVVLLRVCQEALSNVRKHARAASAGVRLSYAGDGVQLAVSDDGRGFDPGAVSEGFGLPGMRARVAEIGGNLRVRTAPGAGTEVTADLMAEVSAGALAGDPDDVSAEVT